MASQNIKTDPRGGDRARFTEGEHVHLRDGNRVQLSSGIKVRTFYIREETYPPSTSVYVGDSDRLILNLDLGLTPDQVEFAKKNTLWRVGLYFGPVELMKVVIEDYEGATFRLVPLSHHICIG